MKISCQTILVLAAALGSCTSAKLRDRGSSGRKLPPNHERFLSQGSSQGSCPFSFLQDGAAPAYQAQTTGFQTVDCSSDNKLCDNPAGLQALQKNTVDPCLEDFAPSHMTCEAVAKAWIPECSKNNTLLSEEFKCGCMSDKVQKEGFCHRSCALCSPVFVNKEGFRSGSPQDLDPIDNLARGLDEYQKPLPRIGCKPYNVSAVADAVRAMHQPTTQPNVTLDIPPTVRMGFHDAADFNKWSGTGGADGRFYNNPESWYGQSRTVNAGLKCVDKLMGYFMDTSLSSGDAIQICAMVSVEMAGGPKFADFMFEPGRYAAAGVTNDGALPGPLGNDVMLRDYFYRAGLNDTDIVALLGGHTLGAGQGSKGSGFTGAFTSNPNIFDNEYFINLVKYENVTKYGCNYFAPGMTPADRATAGCHPTNVDAQGGGVMQLPTDRALMLDPSFRNIVIEFANDKNAFFKQYVKSFKKLSELGRDISVQWCDYNIPPPTPPPSSSSSSKPWYKTHQSAFIAILVVGGTLGIIALVTCVLGMRPGGK